MINHSFVVMAYGDSPYLPECLISIKNQTVKSNIYISTSTPSAYIQSIATKYDIEVRVTEPGKGIAHDWNFGLTQAQTKYVTLAHRDDLYMPAYVQESLKACGKFNDSLISFTRYSEIVNGKYRHRTMLLSIKRLILWFF